MSKRKVAPQPRKPSAFDPDVVAVLEAYWTGMFDSRDFSLSALEHAQQVLADSKLPDSQQAAQTLLAIVEMRRKLGK
jgi:hypothetical protein